jgi:hypothetical protein
MHISIHIIFLTKAAGIYDVISAVRNFPERAVLRNILERLRKQDCQSMVISNALG